ncbi:hypothetical protein CEUSTIGMA_g12384.t1 [Chlamydomonas eustigma]|uniref:Uncharacterized protein n=1 Tax=Chlamydomonas eustigma TaxID=1157962 RepID=A0A250XPN2_9CHLO|nr:hypothetical protein CEUSTIGMA_g12384.t1 [Chlamydomonas eustigma]|eukprot:GAX84963.1 hypothetical protein CEUSTIGMA_g12384.t1 [Chlamydomonas eustigma]
MISVILDGKSVKDSAPEISNDLSQSSPSFYIVPTSDQDPVIDWSSIEEVSSHVSRATLSGMQQLWKQHASAMDSEGKSFAQLIYSMHSQALKEVASMKTFELKSVMGILNNFTSGVRETVLEVFQQMRKQNDEFAQQMYQASRRNFTRNLKSALEARDAWYQDKIKSMKALHDNTLATTRAAAAAEMKQLRLQVQNEMAARTASREQRRNNLAAATAAAAAAATAAVASSAAAAAAASGAPSTAIQAAAGTPASVGAMPYSGATSGLSAASPAVVGAQRQSTPVGNVSMASAAGRMTPPAVPGFSGLDAGIMEDDSFDESGMMGATMLAKGASEAVQALEVARAATEELRAKVDSMTLMVQSEKAEVANWRSKWAQESTKTEGIKRECMQIVTKCEEHVRTLQQQHLTELGQRDYILQRCRDTILNLEARVAELSGTQPVNPLDIQRILNQQQQRPPPNPAGQQGISAPAVPVAAGRLRGPSVPGTNAHSAAAAAAAVGTLAALNAQQQDKDRQADSAAKGQLVNVPPGYGLNSIAEKIQGGRP